MNRFNMAHPLTPAAYDIISTVAAAMLPGEAYTPLSYNDHITELHTGGYSEDNIADTLLYFTDNYQGVTGYQEMMAVLRQVFRYNEEHARHISNVIRGYRNNANPPKYGELLYDLFIGESLAGKLYLADEEQANDIAATVAATLVTVSEPVSVVPSKTQPTPAAGPNQ